MNLTQWFELAKSIDVDGVEFYAGFLEMQDRGNWTRIVSN